MKSFFTLLICLFAIITTRAQCTPTVTLQGSGPTCTNGSSTYTYITESGHTGYTWQFVNTTGATIVSGQGTSTVAVKYTTATTGQLAVFYSGSGDPFLTNSFIVTH